MEHTSLASTPTDRKSAQKSWAPISLDPSKLLAYPRKSDSCVGKPMSSGGCNYVATRSDKFFGV